jgi:hypothetical protein
LLISALISTCSNDRAAAYHPPGGIPIRPRPG